MCDFFRLAIFGNTAKACPLLGEGSQTHQAATFLCSRFSVSGLYAKAGTTKLMNLTVYEYYLKRGDRFVVYALACQATTRDAYTTNLSSVCRVCVFRGIAVNVSRIAK